MLQSRDNSNNRDIRHINGRTYDFTETHNNIRGGHNNKRPKLISTDHTQRTTPNYEPSKLFNVLAGGALLAVLTIGGYNTLANIVKSGIDTKNSIEEYKPTFEEVAENRKVLDICKYYGIRIGYFSEKSMLTRDEAIALNYIIRHKNIPTDLRKRLLSTKHERITETPPTSQITEEEAFTLFGLTK